MSAMIIPQERIENKIYLIRGKKVMLDSDLAQLYGVPTFVLNQSVKRNIERFPTDFMFTLSLEEHKFLTSQIVISKNSGRGGRRTLPYAFTQEGIAMLSSVLHSKRAIQVNIAIMRAFVKLREFLAPHKELARKLEELEKKYDEHFRVVFDAIRHLMAEEEKPKEPIGFRIKK